MMAWLRKNTEVPMPNSFSQYGGKVVGMASFERWQTTARPDREAGETYESESYRKRQEAEQKAWIVGVAQSLRGKRIKVTKEYTSYSYSLKIEKGDWSITYRTDREAVCERIVTGTKHIERSVVPEHIVEAHDEEIVEWVCNDALLSPPEKAPRS